MGEVVHLDERRRRRKALRTRAGAGDPPRVKLYVDLADPASYLAAERVERAFPRVAWRLAPQARLQARDPWADGPGGAHLRHAAERRAAQLRLPLQWPDRFPAPVPSAMRAAAYALEQGRGGAFIIAAGRLAFSGGFDLDDPDVLMEAAAAAGVPVAACLEAAADQARDASMEAAAVRLRRQGVDRVPALRVEGTLLWGEETISAYLATGAHRAALAAERTPLTS